MTKLRQGGEEPGELIPILFDMDLMRPACVILQALSNADRSAFMRHFGGSDKWLTSTTPAMKVWRATEEQWKQVAHAVENV